MNSSHLFSLAFILSLFTLVKGLDCDAPPTLTQLNFFGSTVTNNTLHIPGGQLRYSNIGVHQDQPLDLRVTLFDDGVGDYTNISSMWAERHRDPDDMNGYMGNREFGNINVMYYHGIPNSGVGNFEFCLVDSGTENPVTVTNFSFTVWDLDNRGNDNAHNGIGIKEKLSLNSSQLYNYSVFPDFNQSEVKPICEDGSTIACTDPECTGVHPGHISCDPGVRTVFRGSVKGGLADNPVTPNAVNDAQRKRAVFFLFENTSCFQFTFTMYCPLEPPHDVPGTQGWRNLATSPLSGCRAGSAHPISGGNFLFAGSSDALFTEQGCPTASPTPPPDPTSEPTPDPTPDPTPQPIPDPTPQPIPEPTPSPVLPTPSPVLPTPSPVLPTPSPVVSTGNCPIETNSNSTPTVYGEVKFCVRSSYGYRYGVNNTYQEVNFIESLITIRYNLEGDFCVADFNVDPKERLETTVEDSFGLQAWLCDTTSMTNHTNPDRELPTEVTKYNTVGGTGIDYYNQGALITVCVAPQDEAYREGIRMSSLTDFSWKRDFFAGMGSLEVEQTAIESGSPAGNYLTYYDPNACAGAEWCTFSSVLFADFYINTGSVSGTGTAQLEFSRRRLEQGDRRKLQGEDSSSSFDLNLGVIGMDDGPATLKRAGAVSSGFSVLACILVLVSGLSLLI